MMAVNPVEMSNWRGMYMANTLISHLSAEIKFDIELLESLA
jgi:hypothetical protein